MLSVLEPTINMLKPKNRLITCKRLLVHAPSAVCTCSQRASDTVSVQIAWANQFHFMEAAHVQVEAHHFCACPNEDVRQCVIYDSDKPNARLIGLEYIISSELFEGLPEEEKIYWHSHKFEVSSGTLQVCHHLLQVRLAAGCHARLKVKHVTLAVSVAPPALKHACEVFEHCLSELEEQQVQPLSNTSCTCWQTACWHGLPLISAACILCRC